MSDDTPVRLKAFVGRSFLELDEPVWYEFQKIFKSLRPIGFDFEDAGEAQLRPISEKVRQRIERNDIYLGILTRRLPIGPQVEKTNRVSRIFAAVVAPKPPSQWTTSN